MPKGTYSEEQKAAAFVAWKASNENITAASRETGIPNQTIRDWTKKWEREGPPDLDLVKEAATEFTSRLERARDKALALLESRMHETKNPKDIATIFGILDDKIRLAHGLATSRSETTYVLPSPDQMGELVVGMLQSALKARQSVEQDIIDVIPGEEQAQKALPPGD